MTAVLDFTKIDKSTMTVEGVYDDAIAFIKSSDKYCVFNPVVTKDGYLSPKLNNVTVSPLLPARDGKTLQDLAIEGITLYCAGSNFQPAWGFANFLLKTAVCYVEIIDKSDMVSKCLMCSNLDLLKYYGDTSRFGEIDVAIGGSEVRGIKVNKVRLTRPRHHIDLEEVKGIRVAPLILLQTVAERICLDLKSKILSFKYEKDNRLQRDMCSTLSSEILHKYYDLEKVMSILGMTGETLLRGFLRVPELGASKYDSAVRSLNIAKITSIEEVTEVDTSFINVDFDSIVPTFKSTVQKWALNQEVLSALAQELNVKYPENATSLELVSILTNWVDLQKATGSTMFLRALHKYMLSRPVLFMGYTGERVESAGYSFALGVGEEANNEAYDGGEFVFQ